MPTGTIFISLFLYENSSSTEDEGLQYFLFLRPHVAITQSHMGYRLWLTAKIFFAPIHLQLVRQNDTNSIQLIRRALNHRHRIRSVPTLSPSGIFLPITSLFSSLKKLRGMHFFPPLLLMMNLFKDKIYLVLVWH